MLPTLLSRSTTDQVTTAETQHPLKSLIHEERKRSML